VACIDQRAINDSLDEDIANMPELAAHAATQRLEDHVVFECNWTALEVFLSCTTQWRYGPNGAVVSLDYTALESVMRMMGVTGKEKSDVFHRVRAIEAGALPALAKMRERTR